MARFTNSNFIDSVPINVKDFGATGDGVTDDYTALQAAINSSYGKTLVFPSGTYNFSTSLTIVSDNIRLLGLAGATQTTGGSRLQFTGTSGTAIQVGVAPGSNGTFLRQFIMENLSLTVTENTDVAIDLWHCTDSILRKLWIGGNSDNDTSQNYGLRIRGGVNNLFEMITIRGNGGIITPANYLRYGIYIENGFSNDPATTMTFIKLYQTSCWRGLYHGPDAHVTYYDCIFESNYSRAMDIYGHSRFYGCWWEDNTEVAYTDLSSTTSKLMLISGSPSLNIGTNQTFITTGGISKIILIGNKFASTHANPIIVDTAGVASKVMALGNTIPANGKLINPTYSNTIDTVNIVDGQLFTTDYGSAAAIPRFLTATTAWDPGSIADGAQETKQIDITGALPGDPVTVGFSNSLQYMQLTGYCNTTDSVVVVLRNGTGAPVDLASGTLRVDVWKH